MNNCTTFILIILFYFTCLVMSQNKCEITQIQQHSFSLINCTYVATHSLFFIKIDLDTIEDNVVANYWNSKITRKDSLIPLMITNQFINAGDGAHKIHSNTTLLMPNAIGKQVKGNLYQWDLKLCHYKTNPTGLSGLLAKCELKFQAKIQIQLTQTIQQKQLQINSLQQEQLQRE